MSEFALAVTVAPTVSCVPTDGRVLHTLTARRANVPVETTAKQRAVDMAHAVPSVASAKSNSRAQSVEQIAGNAQKDGRRTLSADAVSPVSVSTRLSAVDMVNA